MEEVWWIWKSYCKCQRRNNKNVPNWIPIGREHWRGGSWRWNQRAKYIHRHQLEPRSPYFFYVISLSLQFVCCTQTGYVTTFSFWPRSIFYYFQSLWLSFPQFSRFFASNFNFCSPARSCQSHLHTLTHVSIELEIGIFVAQIAQ